MVGIDVAHSIAAAAQTWITPRSNARCATSFAGGKTAAGRGGNAVTGRRADAEDRRWLAGHGADHTPGAFRRKVSLLVSADVDRSLAPVAPQIDRDNFMQALPHARCRAARRCFPRNGSDRRAQLRSPRASTRRCGRRPQPARNQGRRQRVPGQEQGRGRRARHAFGIAVHGVTPGLGPAADADKPVREPTAPFDWDRVRPVPTIAARRPNSASAR